MKLTLISATLGWPGAAECLSSWSTNTIREWETLLMENHLTGQSMMESYQTATEASNADVLGFCHDDLVMNDPNWYTRVMAQFFNPSVGLVGFAGALGHGDPEMYSKPFECGLLARRGFLSNLRDAEVHGQRFDSVCDVSVLDGMALFVRRSLLLDCGGWPLPPSKVGYIGYDYWMSCMARRYGYRVRLVGCACDHLGGKSTGLNPNLNVDFIGAHREIYDNFRDVLPAEVR